MASFLSKTSLFSHLPSNQQSRGFHIDLVQREKDLLAEDPSLSWFKSHKSGVRRIKRLGDVLTIVVVAIALIGCCCEIYVRATMREEARKQAKSSES